MTESGSPKTLVFATGNSNKKEEIAALIGSDTELKDLRDLGVIEDIPETGATLHENACIKAQYLWDRFGIPVFADDTGLETTALNNRPECTVPAMQAPQKILWPICRNSFGNYRVSLIVLHNSGLSSPTSTAQEN